MARSKTCKKCLETKLLIYFYKQNKGLLGRTAECKECRKYRTRIWTSNNKEKKLESCRKWCMVNSEKRKEYNQKWRETNPEYFRENRKRNKSKKND